MALDIKLPVEPSLLKGTLTAGTLPTQRTFHVRKSALEKSPIIKGWIDEPSTVPSSMLKDESLYFPVIDPEVMAVVVKYLEGDEGEEFKLREKDHVFYVKVYKLALSLALENLNTSILTYFKITKLNIRMFTSILLEAERGKLLDCKSFRGWVLDYMRQNREILLESKMFRDAIEGGGILAWAICQVLVMGLGDFPIVDEKEKRQERVLSSPPSTDRKRKTSSAFVRGRTSYSGSGKRNLNATVEDAGGSESEGKEVPLGFEQKKKARRSI